MKRAKSWLLGFPAYQKDRTKNLKITTPEILDRIRIDYIKLIQKDAKGK